MNTLTKTADETPTPPRADDTTIDWPSEQVGLFDIPSWDNVLPPKARLRTVTTGSSESQAEAFGKILLRELGPPVTHVFDNDQGIKLVVGKIRGSNPRKDNRVAAVALDSGALNILSFLDQHTSSSWSDLKEATGLDWPEICRGVAMLSGAELCDAGSATLRISEFGDRLLSESRDSLTLGNA